MKSEYFESDEFKKLLEAYNEAQLQDELLYLDVDDYVDLADYYLENDLGQEALEVVDNGLHLHHDNLQLLTVKAGVLIYLHRFNDAADIVDGLSEQLDYDVLYLKGQLAFALEGDFDLAEDYFEQWTKKVENEVKHDSGMDDYARNDELRDAYVHVMTSFVELTSNPQKFDHVAKWIDAYLDRFSPLTNYTADYAVADISRDAGMVIQVERIYTQLLEHDPYLETGWTVLAAAQQVMDKVDEALESVEFALAINPDDLDAILIKAHCFYALNNREKAEPLFQRYVDKTDDPRVMHYLASCLLARNDEEGAYKYASRSREYLISHYEDTPEYAAACAEVAEPLLILDAHYGDAAALVERGLSITPDDIRLLCQKTTLLYLNEQYDAADEIIDRVVLELKCNHAAFFQSIGVRLLSTHDTTEAEKLFRASLSFYNDEGFDCAYAYLALIYLKNQDKENFTKYFRLAQIYHPELVQVLFNTEQ